MHTSTKYAIWISALLGLGATLCIVGMFLTNHPDTSGESLTGGISKDFSAETQQSGRMLDPADAPPKADEGFHMFAIRQDMPWTWRTCGLRNTTEPLVPEIGDKAEGRTYHWTSRPVKTRTMFPWYLMFFIGAWKESRTYQNGWKWAGPKCGASLLTGRYGVTAAHCCYGKDQEPWTNAYVAAGIQQLYDIYEPHGKGSWRKILKCIRHPKDYEGTQGLVYDTGILHWEGPAYKFTKTVDDMILINTICVNQYTDHPRWTIYEFTGWGENMGRPRWYAAVAPGIFDRDYDKGIIRCHGETTIQGPDRLTFCRKSTYFDGGICVGDSGGPMSSALNEDDPDRYFIVGVASTINHFLGDDPSNFDCGDVLRYEMSRVDYYQSFLNQFIESD